MRPSDVLRSEDVLDLVLGQYPNDKGDTPLGVMEIALDSIQQAEDDARVSPMRALTRALTKEISPEEPDNRLGLLVGVKSLASYLLTTGAVLLTRMGAGAARFAGKMVFTAGRFLVERIAIPLITGVGRLLLTTPLGWAITGATLSYFLYKTFFQRRKPSDIDHELRTTKPDELVRADGTIDWGVFAARLGLAQNGSAYSTKGYGVVRPGSAIATATEMARPGQVEVSEGAKKRGAEILATKRSQRVRDALEEAARRTGMDVGILNAIAYKESTFQEVASPGTSSASGLLQFIDSTWNYVVNKYGEQYGVPTNASRNDPLASAIMGAAYLKHDIWPAISKVIPNPTATDLYMGHFMGPAGGAKWLRNYLNNPDGLAALDFPTEAAANRWVYYDRAGNALTYREIYNRFASSLNTIQAAATEEFQTRNRQVNAGNPITSKPNPNAVPQVSNEQAASQAPPVQSRTDSPDAEYARLPNGLPVAFPKNSRPM